MYLICITSWVKVSSQQLLVKWFMLLCLIWIPSRQNCTRSISFCYSDVIQICLHVVHLHNCFFLFLNWLHSSFKLIDYFYLKPFKKIWVCWLENVNIDSDCFLNINWHPKIWFNLKHRSKSIYFIKPKLD